MEIEIKGKLRELRFGIGFIRKLDQVYIVEMNGIPFGMGLTMASAQLNQYNPSALSEVIRCASTGSPSLRSVDKAVEEYAVENDGLGDLFDEVKEEMGKSPIVKDTMERQEKAAEEMMKAEQ